MLQGDLARSIARDPVRVGVIGTGTIARAVHLPLLARAALTQVLTVSDIDQARVSRVALTYGARACTTAELLEDPEVEAVLITTPGDHAHLAEAALLQGKHVLAEKPLAFSIADAVHLKDLAEKRGLTLQVGYMKAFDPVVDVLQESLARAGDPRIVQVRVRHPADPPQVAHLRLHLEPSPAPVSDEDGETLRAAEVRDRGAVARAVGDQPEQWHRLYRNVLCGSLIHELALLRASGLGLPVVEHAELVSWSFPQPPTITISGRFPGVDGPAFQMVWAWLHDFPEYQELLEVTGTAGSVAVEVASPYLLDKVSTLTELSNDPVTGRASQRRQVLGHDGAFQRQIETFALAVRSKDEPLAVPGADHAAEDLRWLQRLFVVLASTQGRPVAGEAER